MRGWRRVVAVGFAGACAAIAVPSAVLAAGGDKQVQKQSVLRATDLPAGWSSEPSKSSDLPAIRQCAGLRAVDSALEPRSTRSREFARSDFAHAQNSVVVLKTARIAKGYLAPYRDPDALACLQSLVKAAFDNPAVASARVTVTPGADPPPGADEAVTFGIQATVTTVATATDPTQTVVVYYDLLIGRVGRALTNFTFSDLGRTLPEQGELVDAVIGRLQDADV